MTTNKVTKKTVQKKTQTSKKATAKSKAPPEKTALKKAIPKTTKATSKPKTANNDKQPRTGSVITYHFCDNLTKKFIEAQYARPIKFKGFEGFHFFMHKSITGKGWTISEASSGASIVTKPTQDSARSQALKVIKQHGHDGLYECVQKSIEKTGLAPGFTAPPKGVLVDKQNFSLTTKDGTKVEVTCQPNNQHHLEFRGEISSTGYRSHFGYDGKSDVKEYAAKYAEDLRSSYLKEKAKLARTNMVHIVKPAPDTKPTSKPASDSSGKGGKPKGKMSMLDAAAEILKTAKEPLCCKDICRSIFEKKLAESSGRTPHATISAAMGREIKVLGKNSRFRRADRGRFELNK